MVSQHLLRRGAGELRWLGQYPSDLRQRLRTFAPGNATEEPAEVMAPATQHALVITPSFFGYERDIVAELESQGWSTLLVDERPSNTAFVRAILRVRKQLAKRWVDRYYRSWQQNLRDKRFDLVLV